VAACVSSLNGNLFITSQEYYAAVQGKIDWVIEPFCVRGSLLMLYGRQGAGKSTLAYQLAHSLASGTPWLGFPVHRTGPVFYLTLDMPKAEYGRLLERVQNSGLDLRSDILPSHPELAHFNIRVRDDRKQLQAAIQAVQPVAVIVDTIAKAYTPSASNDINQEVRDVLGKFREVTGDAVLVYLMHERKKSQFKKLDDHEEDEDAFSGPAAWEQDATTSLRLLDGNGHYRLKAGKTRLDLPGFNVLPLARGPQTKGGLFSASADYQQQLMFWPRFVPLAERFEPSNITDVLLDVAERSGASLDAVKQHFYRQKKAGVEFAWSTRLKSEKEA